ncbi:MAG: hypothetical protein Q4D82_01555 [Neisseria sp.]|nr:hypothetical protein [Neisseria sp.]
MNEAEHIRQTFAANLKTLLAEKGITTAGNARRVWQKAHELFCISKPPNEASLFAWLNGESLPNATNLGKLAEWLDCEQDDLLSETQHDNYQRMINARRERTGARVYALYKGEQCLAIGTVVEIAAQTGSTVASIRYCGSAANARKNSGGNRRILIALDEDEIDG